MAKKKKKMLTAERVWDLIMNFEIRGEISKTNRNRIKDYFKTLSGSEDNYDLVFLFLYNQNCLPKG